MPEKATQDAMQGTKDSKTSPSAINMLNANAVPASDHKKHVASDSTAAIHPDSSDNRPRTTQQPSTTASVPIDLELPLAHSLKALAKEYNIHVSLILAVGWTAILSRLSGQDDILIGYYRDLANGSHTHSGSLPLRIDLSGTPNTVQLLERVRDHGSQPFATESSILVFQALLYWHDQGWASSTTQWPPLSDASSPDLKLHFQEEADGISGEMRFHISLFDLDAVKRHAGYLNTLLVSMVNDTMRPVAMIDILSSEERKLLLDTWNEETSYDPESPCFHQVFERQVEMTPSSTAVVCEGHALSYSELNARANRLAHRLVELGVRLETLVAICVKRSPVMIVSVLAVMKAGGSYVPLDPNYASERLRTILQDANPPVLLADDIGRDALGEGAFISMTVLDPNDPLEQPTSNPHVPGLKLRHLCYVIYTSGTTGKPKGVMIEHRGIANIARILTKFYDVNSTSCVLQFASLSFDASVWEIVPTLSCGATLYIPSDSIRQDRNNLWEYMAEHSVTHAGLTPSFLRNGNDLPVRRGSLTLVLGGEPVNPTLMQNLIAQGYKVINEYGPTETTIALTAWRSPSDFTGDIVPIGRPFTNSRIYILDAHRQPVPLGSTGELYIGGIGVARGYLNRPELTNQVFITDPFSGKADARMYRTGDLAQYLPDGNIIHLGRNDDQVKIHGHRIELGEIGTVLSEHPCVSGAAVVVRTIGDNKQIIAYVIAAQRKHLSQDLRAFLTERLPEYMIPAAFVRMDEWPLTPNDKLDRRALPEPDEDAFAREIYEAPQDGTERILAAVWAELLGVNHIGRHDNFFALGGHSLLVISMLEQLRRRGLTTSVRTVYEFPVLTKLSQAITKHQVVSIPSNVISLSDDKLTPSMLPLIDLTQTDIDTIIEQTPGGLTNIQDIYTLSPLQDGILFHHLLVSEGDTYLLSTQMGFESRELLDRYIHAFQVVVNRHDILRTAFVWNGISTPAQVVWRNAPLHAQEFTFSPGDGSIRKQLYERLDPNHHRIDLTQAPLIHFGYSQDNDGRWTLVQLIHHLICDHAAVMEMNLEIERILHSQEHALSIPQPFRNSIVQMQLGRDDDSHMRFFKEMLADVYDPTFPFELSEVHHSREIAESHQMIPQDLNDRLRLVAKQAQVSLASLCHVAWARVLSLASRQERVVFGTVLVTQTGGDNYGMGLSINTLPFRCDMDDGSIQERVHETHLRLAALLEHGNTSLSLAQSCSGIQEGTPFFSALLNIYHVNTHLQSGSAGYDLKIVGYKEHVRYPGIEFLGSRERTNYPFALIMKDFGNAISLTAQTARPIDPSRVCGYMTQALQSIADALENIPELPVRKLDILPEHERHLLIETWNATKMGFLEDKCIHHLVEVQSRQTPQAIALVFGNQTITYVEMNVRANQLAHRLIDLGVRPDTRVAICVERSASMIIAVLAVLKAGGAYVPLDPTYPNDRLACILEDSRPEVIIVDDMGRSVMEGIGHQSNQDGYEGRTAIPILDLNEELTTSTSNPRVYGLTSRHLCYVIYTSGSTGKPKGVMIEHQGVVNFVTSRLQDWGLEASGQVLQFSSLNFDLSVMETFGCFFSGATLHILPDSIRLDRRELWSYLERHSITLTILPPAILQDCKDLEPLSAPLTLVSCGDALPPSLLRLLQPLVPHGSIINEYGPTETAISDIAWRCPDNFNGDLVPIGRPMGNKRVYILDRNGLPVPLGAIGDLYIGGVGVARGYLNKPELTAQVFVPNPFDGHPEARMYKTGDLARYLPDGNIVFLGRNDFQVKIRGFRIELGEIEARLEDHALVEKSVVLAVGNGNERRLVSYVVSQPVDGLVQTLHSHLVSCLPDYMIPSAIVRLESFPLNSNGKLDRKAFPAPGSDAFALRAYEEPQGTIEVAIAQIWIDLLHLDRVGRSDNFFTLGGHSLLAVRLMNRVASFGVQLPLSAIFATPCLSSFAYVMAKHLTKGITSLCSLPDITTTPRDGYLPPSFSQEYMWTVSQLEGVNDTYHVPLAVRFRGDLHRDALQRAMDTIFARHEALRSTFVTVDGDLQVQILSAQSGIPTHWEDLRGRPDAEVQLKELSKSEIWTPFDLARGPLIRALVVHLDGNEHVFMLIQHHIITDGWSISILQRELSTLYTSYCRGETNPLPPLSIQYPDYASWQRKQFSGDWLEDQRSYWHANLKDAPELLYLPTDRPRPPQQSFAGGHIPVRIDAELTGPLKKFTLDHGMTLYMTILAAWSTVLSRLSGQDDIVIGSLTANRNHHQVESLLGFFVNTLALRIDLSGEPTVGQLIERVKQTTLGAQSNQDVPFQEIVDHVQPHHGPSHAPLFQVLLVWHNNETSKWNLPLLEEQDAEATLRSTEFDLELSLYETDHEIAGNITYSTALFDRETIENHVEYLHLALQELIVDTERPMTTIGIVA